MYRSYIGHIRSIHKLYISHVQPTVRATDGLYPNPENQVAVADCRRHSPFSTCLLCSICGLNCRLYVVYVQLMYGLYRILYMAISIHELPSESIFGSRDSVVSKLLFASLYLHGSARNLFKQLRTALSCSLCNRFVSNGSSRFCTKGFPS